MSQENLGIVIRLSEGWPEPGPYVGVEAVTRDWDFCEN
jgi:hypothetical protein